MTSDFAEAVLAYERDLRSEVHRHAESAFFSSGATAQAERAKAQLLRTIADELHGLVLVHDGPLLQGSDGYSETWEVACPRCRHGLVWQLYLTRGDAGRFSDGGDTIVVCGCGYGLDGWEPLRFVDGVLTFDLRIASSDATSGEGASTAATPSPPPGPAVSKETR